MSIIDRGNPRSENPRQKVWVFESESVAFCFSQIISFLRTVMLGGSSEEFPPTIVVHGGAWAVPDSITEATAQGVKEAAKRGYKIFSDGGTCVDAVVAAVSHLEDDPLFDAGKGAVLSLQNVIETQALLMSGNTLKCGGVIGLKHMKNPIQVAKVVMEKTEHCALAGEAAIDFARQHQMKEMPLEYFLTDAAKENLERLKKYETTVQTLFNRQSAHDTVGAVALDKYGNLACATSTGGITGQMPGRVSDSPIPGAGGYADNESIAISTTGHGESILRISLARLASFYVEQGMAPQVSVEKALQRMAAKTGGYGGAIAVDRNGRVGVGFTTVKMSWAVIGGAQDSGKHTGTQISFGILPGEKRVEEYA